MNIKKYHGYRQARVTKAEYAVTIHSEIMYNFWMQSIYLQGYVKDNHILLVCEDDRGFPYAVLLSDYNVTIYSGDVQISTTGW